MGQAGTLWAGMPLGCLLKKEQAPRRHRGEAFQVPVHPRDHLSDAQGGEEQARQEQGLGALARPSHAASLSALAAQPMTRGCARRWR